MHEILPQSALPRAENCTGLPFFPAVLTMLESTYMYTSCNLCLPVFSGEEYRPETESCNEQEMESWSNSEEEVTNDEPTKKVWLHFPSHLHSSLR